MPAPHALYSKMLAERAATRNVFFFFLSFSKPSQDCEAAVARRASVAIEANIIRVRQTLSLVNAAWWRVPMARDASRLSDVQVKAISIESNRGAARYEHFTSSSSKVTVSPLRYTVGNPVLATLNSY